MTQICVTRSQWVNKIMQNDISWSMVRITRKTRNPISSENLSSVLTIFITIPRYFRSFGNHNEVVSNNSFKRLLMCPVTGHIRSMFVFMKRFKEIFMNKKIFIWKTCLLSCALINVKISVPMKRINNTCSRSNISWISFLVWYDILLKGVIAKHHYWASATTRKQLIMLCWT